MGGFVHGRVRALQKHVGEVDRISAIKVYMLRGLALSMNNLAPALMNGNVSHLLGEFRVHF